jgi:1,4-alpha-glucan branching enzyme
MGGEFAQWHEWQHDYSLEWHLLETGPYAHFHRGVQQWVADLNRFYRDEPAMHRLDCHPAGFEWVSANDADQSVIAFVRRGSQDGSMVLVMCNFTPVPRPAYTIGVPRGGYWREALNSDGELYGGSNLGNSGGVMAEHEGSHGRPCRITATLPPLSVVFFVNDG